MFERGLISFFCFFICAFLASHFSIWSTGEKGSFYAVVLIFFVICIRLFLRQFFAAMFCVLVRFGMPLIFTFIIFSEG
jgi:hypothetical protein